MTFYGYIVYMMIYPNMGENISNINDTKIYPATPIYDDYYCCCCLYLSISVLFSYPAATTTSNSACPTGLLLEFNQNKDKNDYDEDENLVYTNIVTLTSSNSESPSLLQTSSNKINFDNVTNFTNNPHDSVYGQVDASSKMMYILCGKILFLDLQAAIEIMTYYSKKVAMLVLVLERKLT